MTPEELREKLREINSLLTQVLKLGGAHQPFFEEIAKSVVNLNGLIQFTYTKDFTALESKCTLLEKKLDRYRELDKSVRDLIRARVAVDLSLLGIEEIEK